MTISRRFPVAHLSLAALTACGSGSTEGGAGVVSSAGQLYSGSNGAIAGNTLPFAGKGLSRTDFVDRPFRAKFLRSVPKEGGGAEMRMSDAIITIQDGPEYQSRNRDMTITVDGETLTFVDSQDTSGGLGSEQWRLSGYDDGSAAVLEALWTYDVNGEDAFYSEALYILGLETDPAEIEALSSLLT